MVKGHYNKIDVSLLTVSFFAIVASMFLIVNEQYYFKSSVGVRKNVKQIASILTIKNDVRKKSNLDLNWFNAKKDDLLFDQDVVFTGANSTAVIQLNSGGKLNLNPDTLIVVEEKGKASNFLIKKGLISGKLGKDAKLSFVSNGKVQELKGDNTDLNLNISDDGDVNIDVISGQLAVAGASGKVKSITKNNSLKISKDGKTQVLKNNIKLQFPKKGQTLWYANLKLNNFGWSLIERVGVDSFEVEFSTDFSFKKNYKKLKTADLVLPISSSNLFPGKWYWKIKGYVGNNVVGRSSVGIFEIRKNVPPTNLLPNKDIFIVAKSEKIPVDQKGKVRFSWQESRSKKFEFLIAKDKDFKSITHKKEIEVNKTVLELPLGTYYWKVRPLNKSLPEQKWSIVEKFSLRAKGLRFIPSLITINAKEFFVYRGKSEVSLKWKKSKEIKKFTIQVSTNNKFYQKDIVFNEQLEDFKIYIDSLPPGSFFWRVRGIDKQGNVGKFSPVREFKTIKYKPLRAPKIKSKKIKLKVYNSRPSLLEKVVNLIFPVAQAAAKRSLDLAWEGIDGASGYTIQVAKDPSFKKVLLDRKLTVPSIKWTPKTTGSYYWRVCAIDMRGYCGEYSDAAKVEIEVDVVKKVKPKAKVVVTRELKDFKVSWKGSGYIPKYRFIYSYDSTFSPSTELVVPTSYVTIKHFNNDKLYWKVQPIDENGKKLAAFSQVYVENQNVKELVQPRLVVPENEERLYGQKVAFEWSEQDNVANYQIQFAKDPDFNVIVKNHSTALNKSEVALPYGTYFWRVKAIDQGKSSGWSDYYRLSLEELRDDEHINISEFSVGVGFNKASYEQTTEERLNNTAAGSLSGSGISADIRYDGWFEKKNGKWGVLLAYSRYGTSGEFENTSSNSASTVDFATTEISGAMKFRPMGSKFSFQIGGKSYSNSFFIQDGGELTQSSESKIYLFEGVRFDVRPNDSGHLQIGLDIWHSLSEVFSTAVFVPFVEYKFIFGKKYFVGLQLSYLKIENSLEVETSSKTVTGNIANSQINSLIKLGMQF